MFTANTTGNSTSLRPAGWRGSAGTKDGTNMKNEPVHCNEYGSKPVQKPTTTPVRVGRSTALGLRQMAVSAAALRAFGSEHASCPFVSSRFHLAGQARHRFARGVNVGQHCRFANYPL